MAGAEAPVASPAKGKKPPARVRRDTLRELECLDDDAIATKNRIATMSPEAAIHHMTLFFNRVVDQSSKRKDEDVHKIIAENFDTKRYGESPSPRKRKSPATKTPSPRKRSATSESTPGAALSPEVDQSQIEDTEESPSNDSRKPSSK